MTYIFYFFFWTFMIYWMHRIVHVIPMVNKIHGDHHKQVSDSTIRGLHWTNIFLYFARKIRKGNATYGVTVKCGVNNN